MMEENGLPKGWVETTLGEVVEIKNNKILTAEVNLDNYISTENLLPDKRGVTISNALPNILNVNHYKINDTLFSNIRTYFKKVWHADREGGASNDVLIFRPKNNKIFDHKFLYYHISSDNFIDFTVKTARGTKMPRGDKSAIINSKIFIPQEIQEQKAIASILTSFDDKIELLQAQNETLETIAQTIFKEWFGKYQVGDELPEGWRVGKIKDIGKVICGKTPSKSRSDYYGNDVPFIKIPDMHHNIFVLRTSDNLTQLGANSQLNKTIPANSICVSCIATVGLVSMTTQSSQTNQQINSIVPYENTYREYLYSTLKKMNSHLNDLGSGGTATLNVNTNTFSNIEIIMPEVDILNKFHIIQKTLFDKILSNMKQIQTLQQTRDTLLPKLMSGKVRVDEFKE